MSIHYVTHFIYIVIVSVLKNKSSQISLYKINVTISCPYIMLLMYIITL